MQWKKFTTSTALAAAAVATGVSVAGAAPASASPTVCVTGPFGHVTVCNQSDRRDWKPDRPRWRGHWDHDHWRH